MPYSFNTGDKYSSLLQGGTTSSEDMLKRAADRGKELTLNYDANADLYRTKYQEHVVDGDTLTGGRTTGFDAFESTAGTSNNEKARKLAEAGISLSEQKRLGLAGKEELQTWMQNNPGTLFKRQGRDVFGRSLLGNEALTEHMVQSGLAVPTDRYDEKLQSIYRAKQEKLQAINPELARLNDIQREYNIERQNPGILGSIKKIPSAFMSGAQQLAAGIGDTALDIVTPGDNTLLNKAKSAEAANANWGYDDREMRFRTGEAVSQWKRGDKLGAIATAGVVAPEVLGESVPTIGAMFIPGAGWVKAGTALAKFAGTAEGGVVAAAKVGRFMNKNTGFGAVVSNMTNNDVDAYTKNNNGVEPDASNIASMFALNTLNAGIDKFVFKDIIGKKGYANAFVDDMKAAAKLVPDNMVTKVAAGVVKTAAAMGEEAGQEYLQTWGEVLNQKLGTTKYGSLENIMNNQEVQDELLGSALMGAGAGGGMNIAGQGVGGIGAVNTAVDKLRTMEPKLSAAEQREVELAGGTVTPTASTEYTKVLDDTYKEFDRAIQAKDKTAAETHIDTITNNFLAKVEAGELKETDPEYIDTYKKLVDMDIAYNKSKLGVELKEEAQAIARTYPRMDATQAETPDVLGAKFKLQKAIDMGVILDDVSDSDLTETAKNIGLSEESVQQYIKERGAITTAVEAMKSTGKSMSTVEYEATIGDKGFVTQYARMKSAKARGATDEYNLARNQLQHFINTQQTKVQALTDGLAKIEAEGLNNKNAMIKWNTGEFRVLKKDGSIGQSINGAKNIIAAATTTIESISSILAEAKPIAKKETKKEATPKAEVKAEPVVEKTETPVEETKTKDVTKDTTEVKEEATEADKTTERTFSKYGKKVKYIIDKNLSTLALNTKDGIKLRPNITTEEVIAYINSTDNEVTRTKIEVTKAMKEKGVDLIGIITAMNQQEVREFLLLHEDAHSSQIEEVGSREEFVKLYKLDPIKYEMDANIQALESMGLLPTEIESSATVQELLDNAYEFNGIKASDVLEVRKGKDKGISTESLEGSVKVEVEETVATVERTLEKVVKFYGNTFSDKMKGTYDAEFAKESPARLLLNKDGKFDRRVAEAIAIEITKYVAERATDLSYNDVEQIKKMLGVSDGTDIPVVVMKEMSKIGRFHKLEASAMGKGILKSVGLKQKETADADMQVRLEADLGTVAIAVMEAMGIVKYSKDFTNKDMENVKSTVAFYNSFNDQYRVETDIATEKGDLTVPIPTVMLSDAYASKDAETGRKMVSVEAEKYRAFLVEMEAQLGIEPYNKKPRLYRNKKTETYTVRGMEKETVVPAKQNKVLNKLKNREWKVDTTKVEMLAKMYAENAQAVMEMFGWEDPEMVHIDVRDDVAWKNEDIKKSIESIIEYSKEVGNKSVYFDWFFSKNGRFFIDSSKINPQTDKVHRFLMYEVDGESIIKTEEDRNGFKLAVVQAFDGNKELGIGSIDKQSLEKSLSDFNTIINSTEFRRAALAITRGMPSHPSVIKLLETTDHPTHALMALHEIGAYKEKGEFTTDMLLETDAVTSGFILSTATSPVMEYSKVKKWLEKGGVFIGGTKSKSYGEYKELSTTKDSYETGAEGTEKYLENMQIPSSVRSWIKVDRKFMKSPFMTFIYGSGIANIKRAIGYHYADEIVNMLSNPKKVAQAAQILADMEIGGITQEYAAKVTKAPVAYSKSFREMSRANGVMKDIYEGMSTEIRDTYGEATGQYLENEFTEIVAMRKSVNKAFVLLFNAFKKEYDARIKDTDGTKQEVDKVLEEMVQEGKVPGLLTVNSENVSEKAVIASSGQVNPKGKERYDNLTVQSKLNPSARTVHPLVREMVESPASGAVVSIHWEDGSIMTEVLMKNDGLGVHDAVVSGINGIMKTATDYNKESWRITQEYDLLGSVINELNRLNINSIKPIDKATIKKGDLVYNVTTINGTTVAYVAEVAGNFKDGISLISKSGSPYKASGTFYSSKAEADSVITYKALKEMRAIANANKEQMKAEGAMIEHMSYPGSMYTAGKIEKATTLEELKKADKEKHDAIMSVIEKFKDCK